MVQVTKRASIALRHGGFSLIEVLVASLLVAIAFMGVVKLWEFGYNITLRTDDTGTSYNIARLAIERLKLSGFSFTAEGTTLRYFGADGLGESVSQQSNSRYRLQVVVTTDRWRTNTQTGVSQPAPMAKRDAVISVYLIERNELLHSTTCSFVRSGV